MFTSTAGRRFGLLPILAASLVFGGCAGDIMDPSVDGEDPASTDPCTATTQISMNQSMGGSILSGDCLRADGVLHDRWSFTLSQDMSVQIDMTSPTFEGAIELHDSFGNVLGYGDDYGPTNARIITTIPAGSYLIIAGQTSGTNLIGDYQLTLVEGPDCSPIGTVTLAQTINGSLPAGDCLSEWSAHQDNWALSLNTEQKLRIDLKSTEFDEVLLLRDEQGWIWQGADWGGPTGFARLETLVPAGEWTVSVTGSDPNQRGAYNLTVDIAPPCSPGTDFVIGQTVMGEISATDCLFDGYTPADSFGLVIDQEVPLDFHLKSPDFSPTLIVRDANGSDIEFGWDMNQDGNARFQTTLDPGSYSVFAFGYPTQGGYQLTIAEITCDPPTAIAFGATVDGTLDTGDCVRAGGAYQESWELVLATDTPSRIDLSSSAFDAYLIVKDAVGTVIASNDDGGTGLNARIEQVFSAGTYEIVATSFGAAQQGAYQLTVAAPPPPQASSPVSTEASGPKALPQNRTVERIRLHYEAARAQLQRWTLEGIGRR